MKEKKEIIRLRGKVEKGSDALNKILNCASCGGCVAITEETLDEIDKPN